jgi:hypothetical protein
MKSILLNFKIWVLLLFACCSFSNIMGQSNNNNYYYYFKERINFTPDASKYLLKCKKNFNLNSLKEEISKMEGIPKVKIEENFRELDLLILNFSDEKNTDVISSTINQIKSNQDIICLNNFFYLKDINKPACYTNKILVGISDDSKFNNLINLKDQYGLINFKRNLYDPNLYEMEISSHLNGDALYIANRIAESNDIKYAVPELLFMNITNNTNDPLLNQQWALNQALSNVHMNVIKAWSTTSGSPNIRIAVVDSGVDLNHEDLIGNLLPGFDAYGLGSNGGFDGATNAHGTACAGQIAALGNNDVGIAGIAYSSKIIPVRGLFGQSGTNIAISNGVNWSWQNGADVINASYGGDFPDPISHQAVINAITFGRNGLGSVFLASSGNDGNHNGLDFPAGYPEAIAVGATDFFDQRAGFSDYGAGLDISAPGVGITTTDISGIEGYNSNLSDLNGNYTDSFNGTSASCPNAAGVAALILSVKPNLNNYQTRKILEESCDKVGGYVYSINVPNQPNGTWSQELGYGRVNAHRAVSITCLGYIPEFDVHPLDVSACKDSNAVLLSNISVLAPLFILYKWQKRDNFLNWVDIPGANSKNLEINNLKLDDIGYYRCIAKIINLNDGCAVDVCSDEALLIVYPPPVITKQPEEFKVCEGREGMFMVEATVQAGSTLAYQWQKKVNNKWVDIPGATGPVLTIPNAGKVDDTEYRCVISSVNPATPPGFVSCPIYSDSAQLKVHIPMDMSCNAQVNLSLDKDCKTNAAVDKFLDGTFYECFYKVIFRAPDGSILPVDDIHNYVGRELTYEVIDSCDENSCWGKVKFEDKVKPIIDCGPVREIYCYQVNAFLAETNPNTVSFKPVWTDGCGIVTAKFTTHPFVDACEGGYILRKWVVTDGSGNTASCEQRINVIRHLDWMCPDDLVELDCKDSTDPSSIYDVVYAQTPGSIAEKRAAALKASGPFYKLPDGSVGGALNGTCNYFVSFTDIELDACDLHCHGNKKVIRTWTYPGLVQSCTKLPVICCTQVIKAVDVTPPTAIVKDTMVSTRPWDCTADFYLPNPWELHDDCDIDPEWEVKGPVGVTMVDLGPNGVVVSGVRYYFRALGAPCGDHIFKYTLKDCCGNEHVLPINVKVVDRTSPIPVAKRDIVISLVPGYDASGNEDGQAKLFADDLDNGSHDNCGPVRLEIRRRSNAPNCGNLGGGNPAHNNNSTFSNNPVAANVPDNNGNDTDEGAFVKFCCADIDAAATVDANGDGVSQ